MSHCGPCPVSTTGMCAWDKRLISLNLISLARNYSFEVNSALYCFLCPPCFTFLISQPHNNPERRLYFVIFQMRKLKLGEAMGLV